LFSVCCVGIIKRMTQQRFGAVGVVGRNEQKSKSDDDRADRIHRAAQVGIAGFAANELVYMNRTNRYHRAKLNERIRFERHTKDNREWKPTASSRVHGLREHVARGGPEGDLAREHLRRLGESETLETQPKFVPKKFGPTPTRFNWPQAATRGALRTMRVVKSDQRRYMAGAGVGAGVGLAGVGASVYGQRRVAGAQAADDRARSALRDDFRSAKNRAFGMRTAAQAADSQLAGSTRQWNTLNGWLDGRGKDRRKVPLFDDEKATRVMDRSNPADVAEAKRVQATRAKQMVDLGELKNQQEFAAKHARQKASEAAGKWRGFTATAPKVTRTFGRVARGGRVAAGVGFAGMVGGMVGVERSRSYGSKPAQPRYASQAVVGRRAAIDHGKAKAAAYRAGLPAGNMSRDQIDSWYVKGSGER